MSDVMSMLKLGINTGSEGKNKTEKKGEKRKEKSKEEMKNTSSVPAALPGFPEVLPFISKHAQALSKEEYNTAPIIMAYILKYMILYAKSKDCLQKRVNITLKWKMKENEIKEDLSKKANRTAVAKSEITEGKNWQREMFDILDNDPLRSGPFNGPDMYFVLYEFYDPMLPVQLQTLKVPFKAVIQVEAPLNALGYNYSKKSFAINGFWKEYEKIVRNFETTTLLKDIALLKYIIPSAENSTQNSAEMNPNIVINMISFLYSVFNLYRLHETYIRKMKVHRMTQSLEPLDLSKCELYKKICDTIIVEDNHAELFVLFAIIEQVVAGVPETAASVLIYTPEETDFFADDIINQRYSEEYTSPKESDEYIPTGCLKEMKTSSVPYLLKKPEIFLYDDHISLATLNIDKNILKTEDIFNRFLINAALARIRMKFPNLTPAEKIVWEFQFSSMWERSKEKENIFKAKIFFFIVMRLIERIQAFNASCGCLTNSSDLLSQNSEQFLKSNIQSDEFIINENESSNKALFTGSLNMFYNIITTNPKEYVEIKEQEKDGTRMTIAMHLKRATAIQEIINEESTPVEELNIACGRCQKIIPDKEEDDLDNLNQLRQLLESNEIIGLNEPNLLVNRDDFNAFVNKHGFYERLEPIRTVQRLQQLYDNYNSREFTYFPPTDTLFVLGMNDSDFRGIYHSQERGFIISPLSFRDFVAYIIPDIMKWAKKQDAEYIEFLKELKNAIILAEKKRIHNIKCDLSRRYDAGEVFFTTLKEEIKTEQVSPKRAGKREESKNNDAKKKKAENRESDIMLPEEELENLPVKAKMILPKVFEFEALNCGSVRIEVNEDRCEYHSQDGSLIRVSTQSWVYGSTSITITVRRQGSKLFLHKWMDNDVERKYIHLRNPNGIKFFLSFDQHPVKGKITWPNGLIIEPLRVGETFYIKQGYHEAYREKANVGEEEYRCYLQNGQILIFFKGGRIDVLTPSGARYSCQTPKDMTGDHERKTEVCELLSSTGELWFKNDCAKCTSLEKTLAMIGAVDSKSKETFYRREDGTSFMLWPTGKLVTIYPDGTKITSIPEFCGEIFLDDDGEIEKYKTENKTLENMGNSKYRIVFFDDFHKQSTEESVTETFQVVNCYYRLEHPKYASVKIGDGETELRMFGKTKLDISEKGEFKIETHHSVLRTTSGVIHYYNICRDCQEKSITSVFVHSTGNELLCKTTDLFKSELLVYGSGQIFQRDQSNLYTSEEGIEGENEFDPEKRSNPICKHSRNCKLLPKCLVLERDLTAIEFIMDSTLSHYTGSLSEDAYFDLHRHSEDGTEVQHCFFDPIYKTGNDRYEMNYEENDSCPVRIKRKHLIPLKELHKTPPMIHMKLMPNLSSNPHPKHWRPKVIIARFLTVLSPKPTEIMNEIAESIVLYQKYAFNVLAAFKRLRKSGEQLPFDNYVNKELQFIASRLCSNLDLYSHTCMTVPATELDIHTRGHKLTFNSQLVDENPGDLITTALPLCKRITKPLKHHEKGTDISEISDTTTDI